MDALPEFRIVSPTTLAEAIAARADNPKGDAARWWHRSRREYPSRYRCSAGP